MTMTLRINEEDARLIKDYARLHGITVCLDPGHSDLFGPSAEYVSPDSDEMAITNPGLWRYRVGDYRLIAEIQDGRLVILMLQAGHRREIYS